MRAIFSVLGLLIVVAIVGLLMKKQLTSGVAPAAAPGSPAATAPATPQQQVQQFKNAVDAAVQQPRPMPDDTK
jgi:hypothetical protein